MFIIINDNLSFIIILIKKSNLLESNNKKLLK